MARAKRGFKRRRRIKKVFDRVEGFFLRRKNTYRRATEAADRADVEAYKGRRLRKRDFRSLWIARTNAAASANDMSYSRLISALKTSEVQLDRKMLSEIAIHDGAGFTALVDDVRKQAPAN
jgi:large subunit ribosomal protein L20